MFPSHQSFDRPKLAFRVPALSKITALCLVACLAACAKVPLQQGTTLSSYENLKPANGRIAKASIRIDTAALASAKSVRIVPTTVSPAVIAQIGKADDRSLTSNAIDRAMCIALSDRFQLVGPDQPADLTIRASIISILPTNAAAAGVSTVASLGSSAVLPVSLPRLPIGLGGLSVEAEAVGPDGAQKAAMIWSRGADSLTTKARVSPVGDAYSLAGSFGNDFGRMLVKAQSPFKGMGSLPSRQKLWSTLGGKSKYAACERFGRAPGLNGAIGGQFGLPPGWTDKTVPAATKADG